MTRAALDLADDGRKTGSDWMINQLVMIADDAGPPEKILFGLIKQQ